MTRRVPIARLSRWQLPIQSCQNTHVLAIALGNARTLHVYTYMP